jgi:hypothetical protein
VRLRASPTGFRTIPPRSGAIPTERRTIPPESAVFPLAAGMISSRLGSIPLTGGMFRSELGSIQSSMRIIPRSVGMIPRSRGTLRELEGMTPSLGGMFQIPGGMTPEPGRVVPLGMGPDPEPVDRVVFEQAEGSPPAADPDGVDGLCRVDPLEMKAGVGGILLPEPIVLPGSRLDFGGQLCEESQKVFGYPRLQISSIPRSRVLPTRISSRALAAMRASLS